jgi:NADH dehydrogenase
MVHLDYQEIITSEKKIHYDYLVISLGSKPNYYGIPTAENYALTLKSLEQAIIIQNNLILLDFI